MVVLPDHVLILWSTLETGLPSEGEPNKGEAGVIDWSPPFVWRPWGAGRCTEATAVRR